jgi:hypothetical protein
VLDRLTNLKAGWNALAEDLQREINARQVFPR